MESTIEAFLALPMDPLGLHHANHHMFPILYVEYLSSLWMSLKGQGDSATSHLFYFCALVLILFCLGYLQVYVSCWHCICLVTIKNNRIWWLAFFPTGEDLTREFYLYLCRMYHNKRTGDCNALFGAKPHRSRAAGHD